MAENNGDTAQIQLDLLLDKFKAHAKDAINTIKGMGQTISSQAEKDTKGMLSHWHVAYALMAYYGAKAAQKIISAFKGVVNTFAGFEQSLANTWSVASSGADNSAEELAKLEEAARRVGATTRSTASEAANALYYLASAGFSATESIAALDGVNALAIATQSDLARTSETVATVIRQYSLETGEATRVANVFTAAITNSLATMDKLTKSFEYVGPIAAGLGRSVEETTGTLQVLYNKGFSGEKAGRALRRIFVDLADSSSIVNKRLARLGISFNEVNPAVNSMADIIDVLNDSYVDAANASAIFGKISGAQLAALLAAGGDAIRQMERDVTGTNKAFEAMDIQMDTLQGSFDQFKNATEAFRITAGKGLEKVLRPIVDILTSIVRTFGEMPEALAGAAVGLAAVAGVATTLGIAIKGVLVNIFALEVSLLPLVGVIAAVIGGIVTLTAAVGALRNAAIKSTRKEFEYMTKDLATTEEEATKLAFTLADVDYTLTNFTKSMNYAATHGFATQEVTAATLRKRLEDLAKQYGITFEQVLELAENNEELTASYGSQLQAVIQQYDAEKQLSDARAASASAEADIANERINRIKQEKALRLAMQEEEEEKARQLAEVLGGLTVAFERANEYGKLLGETYDRNSDLSSAYESAIKSLVENGLTAESEEVTRLTQLYAQLQAQYGAVINGESDLAYRLKLQRELRTELAVIVEKEKAAIARNEEYDAAVAKSNATIEVMNKLLERGFTYAGPGMTAFLREFGANIIGTTADLKIFDKYLGNVKDKIDVKAEYRESQKAAEEYTDKLFELQATELQIAEAERLKALAAVEGNKKATDAVNAYFDALIAGLKETAEQERLDKLFDGIERGVSAGATLLSAFSDFYSSIMDKLIAEEERYYDRRIELIDEQLQAQLEAIDAAEAAELAALGIVEETELQSLQRQLADALAVGDLITAAQLQDSIDRLLIQDNYDAQRLALQEAAEAETERLEEEKARRIAELQYKQAMYAWTLDSLAVAAKAAVALAAAVATLNPWVIAEATVGAIAAGLQIAAAKPSAPAFADGGIVPGSSTKGDQIWGRLNAGEVVMNAAQQKTVAEKLTENNRPINIHVHTYLDGREVATNSVRYINNGQTEPIRG